MKILAHRQCRAVLASGLFMFLAAQSQAITRIWISSTSINVPGFAHDVAASRRGDNVYAAGQLGGAFAVGQFPTAGSSQGTLSAEYSTSTGYGLGIGVGQSDQVAAIGGVILANGTTAYEIVELDSNLNVVTGWPVYTTGYYDLGGASTTPYRASAQFDASGNLYVGFNQSTTTAVLREYNASGNQVGSDYVIHGDPYVYFEQLAVDTTTAGGGHVYAIVEFSTYVWMAAFNPGFSPPTIYGTPIPLGLTGTGCCRHQSITVGPSGVIAGGQFYNSINPSSPNYTWEEQLTLAFVPTQGPNLTQNSVAQGGQSIFELAQRPLYCGETFWEVGDSTGIWTGLYQNSGGISNTTFYDKTTAYRGNSIATDALEHAFVCGQTKAGNFFVEELLDTGCTTTVPPAPSPCTTTPWAFPNPFQADGKNQLTIEYDLLNGVYNASPKPTVSLNIYGPGGGLVDAIPGFQGSLQAVNVATWNGENQGATLVSPGTYDAELTVDMSNSGGPVCYSIIRIGVR